MEEEVQIQKLSQERLDNALHLHFHASVRDWLREADLKKIGLPKELVEEYEKCVQDEQEMIKETRARFETPHIAKKEKECNHWLSYIAAVVRAMRLSPDPDEVKAAEMLYLLWRSDKPLQGVSLGRKSAGITSLLIDLKDDRYAPLITRLRLDRGVQLQRIKARSKPDLPSSTDLRPTTDAVYRRIVKYLELSYMNASPDGQAAITELVHLINKMVDHTRTAYKQSLSQRRARRRQKEAREEGQA